MNRPNWNRPGPEAIAGVILTILLGFAVALIAGASLGAAAAACALLLLAASLLAVHGWRTARERAEQAASAAARAGVAQRQERESRERDVHRLEEQQAQERRELQDHAGRLEERHAEETQRLERHVRRLQEQHEREGQLLRRLRQSWQAEREWSRELRAQIQHMSTTPTALARDGDVQALILEAAIKLVEAPKGLLISRRDDDRDGSLDVALSHGFENDPRNSAVAQRFARAVLARDEILREDDPNPGEGAEPTPADREIDTLVAIPLYMRDRFHGVIVCANRPGGFEEVGDELLLALGDHAGAALQHGRLQHELRDAQRSSIRVLAEAVSAHDPVFHRETGELAMHAGLLAGELGLDDGARDVLISATLLRGVGYLPLPERPRLRPGPLTPDERSLIELHPRLGYDILTPAPALHDVAVVVLYHHERFDGTGYPAGLSGDDIPLAARVLAVLEAYGAMTHERPYREPCSPEQVCEVLRENGGTQFDPEITQLFLEQVRRAPRIVREDVSAAVLDALPLEPGELVTSAVDGATLLSNRRGLHQDLSAVTKHGRPFGIVVLELAELPQVNVELGHLAGDRLIEQAARRARRAAARLGGTAYRLSGRRLAIVVPARDGTLVPGVLEDVRAEFVGGPAIVAAISTSTPEEAGEAVLARAREGLRRAEA
jgi:HD-GYP domain-containing protein (c-di-GMP phosphodiesterase class II)